jgi:hypothetical protein
MKISPDAGISRAGRIRLSRVKEALLTAEVRMLIKQMDQAPNLHPKGG